jgi:hypothetical protein
MDIKKFINTIKDFRTLDNKEQVPYFIYFIQKIKNQEGVTQSDIKKCFEQTNIHLSINLSIHFNQNIKKKKGKAPRYILRKNKYFLENSLEEEIKLNLKIKNNLDNPDEILIHTGLNDKFYDKLIEDINNSFYHEIYTGCFILARKLFENMIIDILRNNFKKEKELFQNEANKKKYNDFSILLDSLKKKKSELGFTITEIEGIIDKLNPYRIEANSKTHSIVDFGKKEELKKYNIELTFDLLKRVWQVK